MGGLSRRRIACSGFAVLVVAALGALALSNDAKPVRSSDGPAVTEFNAEQWRQVRAAPGARNELAKLADAAIAQDALIGKTSSELSRMLGKPDRVLLSLPPFWEWDLGAINGFSTPGDTKTLSVHFDRWGRSDRAARGH